METTMKTMTNKTAEKLIGDIFLFSVLRHCENKPDAVIMKLSQEKREMVKQLKSEHFQHRDDEVTPNIWNKTLLEKRTEANREKEQADYIEWLENVKDEDEDFYNYHCEMNHLEMKDD